MARFEQGPASIEITAAALQQKIADNEHFMLVDVREADERAAFNIGGRHIPLREFLQLSFSQIDPEAIIVIYCERGGRSLQSARHLREKGFANAYSLQGGMQLWRQHLPKG